MKHPKPGNRKILLSLLILVTIAGCNFPRQETLDPRIFATPTLDALQAFHATETAIHKSRVETFSITMPQLGNRQRNIQVYLPPDYNASNLSYPVIYLFDGESLFNPPPETVGDYQIDETLDRLYAEKLTQGMIVVGIEYDPDYPWSEYMPWVNPNMHDWVKPKNSAPSEGGEGGAFLNFVVDTLKPEIDRRYRTFVDRDNTMIGGFCRTAVIPLYAVLSRPDIFSKAMVMSPAVWMAEGGGAWLLNNQLINFINNSAVPADLRVYIDIGTEEESGPRPNVYDQDGERITYPQAYVEGAEKLYEVLLAKGILQEKLRFEIVEGAAGIRDAWAKRFGGAILWLSQKNE